MIHENSEQVLLHLSLIDHIGPSVVRRLLSCLQDNILDVYTMSVADLVHQVQLPHATAQRLSDGLQDTAMLNRELELLAQYTDIAWFSVVNSNFPQQLKEIHLPPIGIYVRGRLPNGAGLAVVGSRNATAYGQRAIDRIISPLCQQGTVIVSGGARGIDTMAHTAAIANNAPTVAVLGSGLLQPYPSSNRKLFHTIVEQGGALVSAFPLTMQALASNFPARNRIIAGLSYGTLVVQAAKKSGALITATYALEQGREVFAVPGALDDPLSVGCHSLLRQGATLVQAHEDIVEQLPIFTSRPAQLTIDSIDSLDPSIRKTVQTDPHIDSVDSAMSADVSYNLLDEKLVALCAKPISVDDLSDKLSMEILEVQARLFALQVAGRLQQNFMGLWHI